jgi:hypothetical protein
LALPCPSSLHAEDGADLGDSDVEERDTKRARGRPPGVLLMFVVLLCAPAHSSHSSIVGMPGMFKELAQKGRDILSKCNDQLKDAEEPEHGRAVWIQMRELLDRRAREGRRPLGSAEDKGVYNILHVHFMEDRGHAAV